MVGYYRQRAGAGVIISEATGISRQGPGWVDAPGIWNDAQVEGWKPVTRAVHDAGGRIMLQLWHMGRLVHSDFLDGEAPVSSTNRAAPGGVRTYRSAGKRVGYSVPRALTIDEIRGIVADYARAARNTIEAGFGGVHIHAANGYLIDQFLRDNTRPDRRIWRQRREPDSPPRPSRRCGDRCGRCGPDRGPLLAERREPGSRRQRSAIAVHRCCGHARTARHRLPRAARAAPGRHVRTHRRARGQPVHPSGLHRPAGAERRLSRAGALEVVASGRADAVAFGRPFIANPDLVERLRLDGPVAESDVPTWYAPGPNGYIDYPRLDETA